MSKHDDTNNQTQGALAADEQDSFGVGYMRPPRSRAFKKGHSGNPAGRSKGRRNLPALLKDLLNGSVPVRLGEKTGHMSKAEAMLRIHVGKARQGDDRALDTIVGILDLAGQFDELSDDERNKYGVIEVPEKLPMDEWELLFGPNFERERQKYLAMPDLVDPNYVPTASDLKSDAFVKQITIGDELRTKGDLDGALAIYRASLDIMRQVSAEEPGKTLWWHYVAHGLRMVGSVLQIQGNLTDVVPAFREALDLFRKITAARPDIVLAKTDTAALLCMLADVGDDSLGRLNEALKIVKALSERGQLKPQQKGWIGKIEQDLATLTLTGTLNQSKPRKVTRPVLGGPTDSSKVGGPSKSIGNQRQGSQPARNAVVVSEIETTLEQWKKSSHLAATKTDERLMSNNKRPEPVHRKVGYNLDS